MKFITMNRHFETLSKNNNDFIKNIENMLDALLKDKNISNTFITLKGVSSKVNDFNDPLKTYSYDDNLYGGFRQFLSDIIYNAFKLHNIGNFISNVDFMVNFRNLDSIMKDSNTFYLRDQMNVIVTDNHLNNWIFNCNLELNSVFLDKVIIHKDCSTHKFSFSIGRYSNNIVIEEGKKENSMMMIYGKENDYITFKSYDNSLHSIFSEDVLHYDFLKSIHEYSKMDVQNGIHLTEEFIFNNGKLNHNLVDVINLNFDYDLLSQSKNMINVNNITTDYKLNNKNFFRRLFNL